MQLRTCLCVLALLAPACLPAAPEPGRIAVAVLSPCRLVGVEHEAACGAVERPLDPGQPQGRAITIHFAVLPALARNKKADPVFFFAGGPGQSAMALAGPISRMLARFSTRRDIVLVDQRGTGRSAPLTCAEDKPTRALRDIADPAHLADAWRSCRDALVKLPHGDLRRFTTTIAMQDVEAVRKALGVGRINLVGGSYGTRAALEYMRQFPHNVRRVVIDGVAPPDMVMPLSFSTDTQAAFEALLGDCAQDAACRAAYPALREDWHTLLQSLPREVTLHHPVTLQDERLTLTRDMVTSMVRLPLYVPALASALPLAVSEAARGRFGPLAGLTSAMTGGRGRGLAQGMHFSVVCAEDMPLVPQSRDKPGADFGESFGDPYRRTCADWPRGDVPPAFYTIPPAPAAALVLSGGIDPATPPRHGERVAQALGAKARHVVVPHAGHGVMALGCMRDVLFRFIDADDDSQALQVDAACAQAMPRPPALVPPRAEASR